MHIEIHICTHVMYTCLHINMYVCEHTYLSQIYLKAIFAQIVFIQTGIISVRMYAHNFSHVLLKLYRK
jgi:hypothetical protein